jgi:hypothetical protein
MTYIGLILIFLTILLLQCQEHGIGTCAPCILGFNEDGVQALKHAGIMYVTYDF